MFTRILEAALASIGDGVLVINAQGAVLFANSAARRLLGEEPRTCGLWPEGARGDPGRRS